MKTSLKNGVLTVEIPVNGNSLNDLPESASGKSRIVASTGGNQASGVTIDGQAVIVGLNAYVRQAKK